MDSLYSLRTEKDEFKVEYEILITRNSDVKEINQRISTKQIEISKINEKIAYLTNQADTVDYTTAVACGLISGMIDSWKVFLWYC